MRAVFAAVAVLVCASSPAFSMCPEAEQKKLEEFDRAWGIAGEKGDRAHLQSILADDFAGLTPAGLTGKVKSIDTTIRDFEAVGVSGRPAPKAVHDYYMISCTPMTATITHRNVITEMVDGKERTQYTRSVHFLEKRGNGWQVVSNAGHPLGDAAMLLYMEREWNDADVRGDFGWHQRSFADDYSGISSRTGALSTKSEDIASSKKMTVTSAQLSDLDARVEGPTAVVTGINHYIGKDAKGVAFDRNVRFTDTFVKRDGRWLVWASQGTEIKN